MKGRKLLLTAFTWIAIATVPDLKANDATADARHSAPAVPVIVLIGSGETSLGSFGRSMSIGQQIFDEMYVSSKNKKNRRYSQRAYEALLRMEPSRIEEAARAAFGCESPQFPDQRCKNAFVWPMAGPPIQDSDIAKLLQENGWPASLIVRFWIESSDEGIEVRGFAQHFPENKNNGADLLPLGYVEAAPEEVMKSAAGKMKTPTGRAKPGDWMMENYWLTAPGTQLQDAFVRGMTEMRALLDFADPSSGTIKAEKLVRHSKRRDQLRSHKAEGLGCRDMAHCNSMVMKKFPSRLWVVRGAVGYAYLAELVSEPIVPVPQPAP